VPVWPLHGWLPDAYRAAPLVITGLLAAVMSKAGVYGLIRVGLPTFPDGAENFAIPLSVLALVGILYGSLVAWRSPTMRMLVGYSSLAHLGFIVLGIMAFDLQAGQGAVLQMVNHGLVVAATFAIVGMINRGTAGDRIDRIGGLAAGAPRLATVFLIVAMAALAIPGSNAFVGEFFILTGVFRHHVWLAVLATIGIVLAAVYMLRLYQSTMNGPPFGANIRATEMRWVDYVVLGPIVAAMLVIALWPASIVDSTRAPVAQAIAPAQIAAERPLDQIERPVVPNPPSYAQPLPGDEPQSDEGDPSQGETAP
jgi:NADH-quinone oxidoreductase subunit M